MRITAHGAEAGLDRRHRLVLSTLAIVRPHAATIDQIAEAVWPGAQPVTRDKVIQGSISALRRAFGKESIETVPAGYRLADDVLTAADEFERKVARAGRLLELGHADRAGFLLADALASWPGSPFDDVAHWPPAVAEQARLSLVLLRAEELQVQALLASGDAEGALVLARRQAQDEPLRERRWLSWATAAYASGDQSSALQVLRDCRRTFDAELGIVPSDELRSLEVAILRHDPSLAVPLLPAVTAQCPWPGLRAYEQDDAETFFGREPDVARGLGVLDDTGHLAVAGPSGIGKSSLVRAGVASALADTGLAVLVTTPLAAQPEALVDVSPDVIVLDQAEELFALPREQAAQLLTWARRRALVLAIRTDRLSEASALPALAQVLESSLFLLGELGPAGLRAAVEQPSIQNGLLIEPGLVELLLRDMEGDPGALPMFSHALAETWHRREGRTLTIDGYLATGGVRGALAQTAESLYTGLDAQQQHGLHSLMLRLVSTAADGTPIRARVPRDRVAVGDDLVERLVAARLVTSDNEWLSLTHDALITAWPRLGGWLADDVDGRRQLHHLSDVAASWDELGRPSAELYRGPRLHRAVAWADSTDVELSGIERAFLAASRRQDEADQARDALDRERERRSIRRLRTLVVGLACATTAAALAGGVALAQQRRSVAAARASAVAALEADANRVGAVALATDDAQLSLLLAVAAQQLAPGPVTDRTLSTALAARPELIATGETSVSTPTARLRALVSGGTRVFALDARHVLHVLTPGLRSVGTVDVGGGTDDRGPMGLAAATNVVAAAAAPGRSPAITITDAVSLHAVDVALQRLPRGDVRVLSLDLTPDGRTLAAVVSVGGTRSLMVWGLPGGRLRGKPVNLGADASVRLSDDGRIVFTSLPLEAHDVTTGRLLWSDPGGTAPTFDVHGSVIAAPSPDGVSVELRDASNGLVGRTLAGAEAQVGEVSFSPGGGLLAATTSSGAAVVWEMTSGQVAHRLGTRAVRGLAFSAGGDTLFTGGGRISSVLAWDLQGRRSFLTRVPRDGFGPLVQGVVAISPDGNWLAMASTAGERPDLRLGSAQQQAVRVVTPSGDWRGVGAWAPNGGRFAYADGRGYLSLVSASGEVAPVRRRVSADPVNAVAFDGTGSVLALEESGDLAVLDAESLSRTATIPVPRGAVAVSATRGRAVVTTTAVAGDRGSSGPGSRWHLIDLEQRRVESEGDLRVDDPSVASLSPEGSRLAVGGENGELVLIDVAGRIVIGGDDIGSGEPVSGIAWSSAGTHAVVSVGLTLQLWDAVLGRQTAQVRLPAGEQSAVTAFTAGDTVSVLTRAGNVYRWDPSPQAAAGFACRLVGRELTATEWREAFGDRPVRPACP